MAVASWRWTTFSVKPYGFPQFIQIESIMNTHQSGGPGGSRGGGLRGGRGGGSRGGRGRGPQAGRGPNFGFGSESSGKGGNSKWIPRQKGCGCVGSTNNIVMATLRFEPPFATATVGPKTISTKSTNMDTKTMKYESSDVVEDIEPISMITDGTNKHYLDTNGTVERQMKKPKVEVRFPIIRDKQFWKAGDYESCGNNSEMLIPPEVVRPIRNSEASKPAEYAQYDATPEAYASTSRKSPFNASTSSKVLKASTNSILSKAQTLNANGYASVGHEVDIVEELRKDNHELKQRVGSTESEMINSLLRDLLSERDKNALLEKQVQKAEEKIKKLDEEHEAIIGIFSDERSRQYDMEASLRKKWQVRSAMILAN